MTAAFQHGALKALVWVTEGGLAPLTGAMTGLPVALEMIVGELAASEDATEPPDVCPAQRARPARAPRFRGRLARDDTPPPRALGQACFLGAALLDPGSSAVGAVRPRQRNLHLEARASSKREG